MKQQQIIDINTKNGFTLIELMIVVAIIGIISTFAYSSYQESVRKTKRAEAKTTLMDLAQRLERSYTANGNFDTANSVHDGTDLLASTAITEHGHYNVVISNLAPTTFTLTATATFTDPQCTTFTIDNTGLKTAADDGGADATTICW